MLPKVICCAPNWAVHSSACHHCRSRSISLRRSTKKCEQLWKPTTLVTSSTRAQSWHGHPTLTFFLLSLWLHGIWRATWSRHREAHLFLSNLIYKGRSQGHTLDCVHEYEYNIFEIQTCFLLTYSNPPWHDALPSSQAQKQCNQVAMELKPLK